MVVFFVGLIASQPELRPPPTAYHKSLYTTLFGCCVSNVTLLTIYETIPINDALLVVVGWTACVCPSPDRVLILKVCLSNKFRAVDLLKRAPTYSHKHPGLTIIP